MQPRRPTKEGIAEVGVWLARLRFWAQIMCKNDCGKLAVAGGIFCSRSCSASYNNRVKPKRKAAPSSACLFCGSKVGSVRTFCSNGCQQSYQHQFYINSWIDGGESGRSGMAVSKHVVKYLHKLCEGVCARCEESIWLGEPIALQVDHKDGNHKNCRPENLWLLCPNCHAQQPTSGARNKGRGRADRLVYSEKTNHAMRQALAKKTSPP